MGIKSGPNISKASLIFSMDGATPRGFSSARSHLIDEYDRSITDGGSA